MPGLHRAVFFRDRRDRETVAGARILAGKALVVGEDHAVAARVELGALGIFDSAIGPERGALGRARDFQRAVGVDYSARRIGEFELRHDLRMKRRVGQAGPLVGRGQTGEAHRVGDEFAQRLALELGGRRGGRGFSDKHAHAKAALARTLELLDLAHAHTGAERLAAHDQNLSGVGARGARLLQAPLREIDARFN